MADLTSVIHCLITPQTITGKEKEKKKEKETTATGKPGHLMTSELRDALEQGDFKEIKRLTTGPEGSVINNMTKNRGWSPLHIASFHGYDEIVDYLFECGAEIDNDDFTERTPLFLASQRGHLDIAKHLVERGANVNRATIDGRTPLFTACHYNHFELVVFLLENKATINQQDRNGHTPLFMAAYAGFMDIVQHLVSQNVDKDLFDEDGWTAYHTTMINGHYEIGKYLAESGANVSSTTRGKYTALHLACQEGSMKNVHYLMRNGADINLETAKGVTALMLAAGGGHLECVQLLLDEDADVHMKDNEGWSPLHYASISKNQSVMDLLLSRQTVIEEKNAHGQLPLHIAITTGNCAMASHLIRHQMKSTPQNTEYLNSVDGEGMTPIHLATMMGLTSLIEMLLELRADINKQSYDGRTPLHIASTLCNSANTSIALTTALKRIQRDSGENITPAQALVKFLVERGSDMEIKDARGYTAGHYSNDEFIRHTLLLRKSGKNEDDYSTVVEKVKPHIVRNIGFEGATLHLDRYGITMSIKPGVVEPGSRQEFSLEVLSDCRSFNLEEEKAMVSLPLKYRLPERWEFTYRNPVFITVPHSANVISSPDFYPDVITRNPNKTEHKEESVERIGCTQTKEGQFKLRIFAEDESITKEACVTVHKHETYLRFMYTPYLPSKRESGAPLILRVYFHADIPGVKKDIEEERENSEYRQAHPSRLVQLNPLFHDVILSCNGVEQTLKTNTLLTKRMGNLEIPLSAESNVSEWMVKILVKTDELVQSTMCFMALQEDTQTSSYAEKELPSVKVMSEKQPEDRLATTITKDITVSQYYHLGAAIGFAQGELDRIQAEASSSQGLHSPGSQNKSATLRMISMWRQVHPVNADYYLTEIWTSIQGKEVLKVAKEDTAKTLEQEKSPRDVLSTESTYREKQNPPEADSHQIDVTIPLDVPCKKEDIIVKALDNSPPELKLYDNEAVIAVGLKLSPAGQTFKSPIKIAVRHSARFTRPSKAELAFYYRNDGESQFTRITSSDPEAPQCVVRDHDLDLYVSHFSEWWIVSIITRFFLGKLLICTPYVNPQLTTLFLHLKDSGGSTSEDPIPGFRAILPSAQFFVKWHSGSVLVKYIEDNEEIEKKNVTEQSFYYVLKHTVYIPSSSTNISVLKKLGYILQQGRVNEVDIRFDISADAALRMQDNLLYDIADEIETYDHLDRLMMALKISQASRIRYHDLNRLEGHITTRGSREMLMNWRAETAISEQRKKFKDALTQAKLLDLRDRFFPKEATTHVETVGTHE